MAKSALKKKVSSIEKRLNSMLENANKAPAFFARVVEPEYKSAQAERWKSENKSQGAPWTRLDPEYKKQKLKRYADYPGSGTKTMIATNRLVNSILGKSQEYRQVIGDKKMVISTTVPYAEFADADRSISKFSPEFYRDLRARWLKFIKTGR
jgi:hypothetical protein